MTLKNLVLVAFFAASFFACQSASTEKVAESEAPKNEKIEVKVEPQDKPAENTAPVDAANAPTMDFESVEHNFGTVQEGTKVKHIFKFKNNGKSPLIISDARTSCGCTVPEYPKGVPIAPGESSEIKVEFDSKGKSGNQQKDVTFSANIVGGQSVVRIVGNVESPEKIDGPFKKK